MVIFSLAAFSSRTFKAFLAKAEWDTVIISKSDSSSFLKPPWKQWHASPLLKERLLCENGYTVGPQSCRVGTPSLCVCLSHGVHLLAAIQAVRLDGVIRGSGQWCSERHARERTSAMGLAFLFPAVL